MPPSVDTQDEFGSAIKDFNIQLLNPKEYSHRVNQVVEEKKKRRWVQDSDRRRVQITKDNFVAVPLGRSRKEIATQWFQDLASSKPLSVLSKKIPVFNKKEEIFDNLCEKDVPISRATWYIKMAAAHSTTMNDVKLNKKKQAADPSYDWTVSLTKYMQECVWRISNEPTPTPRQEAMSAASSGGRHSSTSGGQAQTPSEEGMAEHIRWQYMVYLSSWLYQENLLDCHEFLHWLVERVDHIKAADTKGLQLYLPLVLKHLLDIASCVALARPLVKNCCQRLSTLFELEQRLAKLQPPPSSLPLKTLAEESAPVEDDSVFESGTTVTIKQEPGVGGVKNEPLSNASTPVGGAAKLYGTRKKSSISSVSRDRKHTAGTPSALADGEVPIITMKTEDDDSMAIPNPHPAGGGVASTEGVGQGVPGPFHWCTHHQSLMLQLCSIIQTVSLRCPTAFVQTKVFVGRGVQGGKPTLSLLPMGLTELTMPKSLSVELQKKLASALSSTEQEITMRNKAVESDWSAVAVADLQTTSEGCNVQQVLKLLEVMDTHSFTKCHAYNPLTTLYHRISAEQRGVEHPLTNEMFAMLLCQWAVTPHRSGRHRPLVAARILRQRQDQVMRGGDWKEDRDKASMDSTWEDLEETTYTGISDIPFPFQPVLVKFLDQRAPLPDDLSSPVKCGEPFYELIILYCELMRLSVFSYTAYLSTLMARGEIKQAIIPFLQFAQEEMGGLEEVSRKRHAPQDQELHLSIPLPALKQPHLDTPGGSGGGGGSEHSLERGSQSSLSGIASGPPSPGGTFSTGMGNFMDILSGGDPTAASSGTSLFPPVEVEVSEIQIRQQQLQMLTAETSNLDSPIDFAASTQDITSPSHNQTKADHFNFSLSTFFMEEEHVTDPTLDKHGSRHLIYAAYFPINGFGFGRQEKNERSVVLCGVGRVRQKVEGIIKQISSEVEHYFRLLNGIQKSALFEPKIRQVFRKFQSLPSFEQHLIATTCENILREPLSRKNPYPACSQLVFVCELLETCGALHQLITLLVDVVACDFPLPPGPKGDHRRGPPPPPCLPHELCLPVMCLLHSYLPCLLLSQHDTTVVFENLCRVMDSVQSLAEVSLSQKAVFLFLHTLYTNCSYLQTTFRSRFGHHCMQLGDSLLVESYSPLTTESGDYQKILQAKPGDCNVPKLCLHLKAVAHQSKVLASFAMDAFITACSKGSTCESLCDLTHICAAVSSSCGPKTNRELMGAFRALCMPSQGLKGSHAGYSLLTGRTNVPKDRDIHSPLITFACLLLARNCFLLSDVVVYIIRPVIRFFNAATTNTLASNALEFVNSLILHLFVDAFRRGDQVPHGSGVGEGSRVTLPLFAQHSLQAQCRRLPLGYIMMMLKDLVRLVIQKGDSVLMHGNTARHEFAVGELKKTMERVCGERWVRSQCSTHSARLLDTDMLGDKVLTSSQARHLLLLCCPYSTSQSLEDVVTLAKSESSDLLEDILKNLDQWTLSNSLLHINASISHALGMTARSALLDDLAAQVIRVFEDSCGDEWLGQTIESSVEGGDGSFSPSVWLVTPLISKLQESVLGRVLKSAGNVLGQGQWWNPEKNQEKRRSTRATSGVTTPKTGLQWQQPFLELVLACMHAQSTTHEELLTPLKSQLSNFLSAFDKEGMPTDEHGKAMLFAALKLRLSLVGSMLASICTSESNTLDWLHLLMQVICSGAIDRQTDTSELFTNCLDMISTLLGSLSSEFHYTLAGGGEEGKKVHTGCIKKIKAELANSKSYCASEIRQLFPVSPKMYAVTTVKPPSAVVPSKGSMANERVKGLRVQDVKEISPWEILEGVKNSGPLMLSWFGAVRMKRKPLWFEEQRNLVRFHTHQNQSQNFISNSHTVKLPTEETVPPLPVNTAPQDPKGLSSADPTQGDPPKSGGIPGGSNSASSNPGVGVAPAGGQMAVQAHAPQQGVGGATVTTGGSAGGGTGGQMIDHGGMAMAGHQRGVNPATGMPMQPQMINSQLRGPMRGVVSGSMHEQQQQSYMSEMRHKLTEIYQRHIQREMSGSAVGAVRPMYPPNMGGSTPSMMMAGGSGGASRGSLRHIQAFQQHHQRQQHHSQYVRIMQQRQQQMQQQQQQQQMMGQQYGGPGGPYRATPTHVPPHMMNPGGGMPSGMHQVQPMQANPPMPMQQVMQQRQGGYPAPHAGGMAGPPHPAMGGQPYQGAPGMNQTLHRQGMF